MAVDSGVNVDSFHGDVDNLVDCHSSIANAITRFTDELEPSYSLS